MGSAGQALPAIVILIMLTVGIVLGVIPARRIWQMSNGLGIRFPAGGDDRTYRARAGIRMFHSLYLGSISFIIAGWLIEGYTHFEVGEAHLRAARWFGPNSLVQYLELYLGATLLLGLMFAFIIASITVYWFNRPKCLVSPKMRSDIGMWKRRQERAG